MGKVNYYRKFIADFSDKASSLYALLKKDAKFVWNSHHDDAFHKLREDIIKATKLAHYDASKNLILATDASKCGIGAVLMIEEDGHERPIAHESQTLTETQKAY